MADKASSSKGASSSSSSSENPKVARRPSKYPTKGPKKPFVDARMKDVITANLKMVLGKLGNITDIITTRNKEIGGDDVKRPKIIQALRDANVAFQKLEAKQFPDQPQPGPKKK